ncbi:plastocyanin/azurin family copper-binding protein [Erythrobacter sp.]|uniref:plastocyanin/azurin family copper-binding protein n=1 Tax=Erythrobacter sp. TaxID=1042 RepID=UPI001425F005|nr:plastocyanin/azurin family copper-binding protein [Erythrobacter sp.]QIQ86361.1 MAG: pseudoazurin [Erythrobacter sp.]
MLDRRTILLGAGATALLAAGRVAAQATSHVVEMTGSPGGDMAFSPRVLRVAPGDSVTFRPVGGPHNCQSTPGMIPQGANSWRGRIGQPVTVTFGRPGYYGYHCLPHRGLGMVGLVIVEGEGRDANLEAARAVSHPGKAAGVWAEIWDEVVS